MTHIGLFEGIGGFSLSARFIGWQTVAWCEWDEMCQRHLRYHFPEAEGFGDITQTDFTKYADKIDILTGGFPCQPFSTAGKRKGTADARYLWPEMLRAIREIRPRWIVGENVRGLVNWDGGLVFETVHADLEAQGYEVLPFLIPACAVDAPHRRDRVWIVGHAEHYGLYAPQIGGNDQEPPVASGQNQVWQSKGAGGVQSIAGAAANPDGHFGREGRLYQERPEASTGYPCPCGSCFDQRPNWQNFPTQPTVCGGDDGLPSQLDGTTFSKWRNWSIKSYGNAVVPQVVFQIYKAIQQYQSL